MTDIYAKCNKCDRIICNPDFSGKSEHFVEYHLENYKKIKADQTNLEIGYVRLKEKYPLAQRGFHDFFSRIDKYELTMKQKLEIKKSEHKGVKVKA